MCKVSVAEKLENLELWRRAATRWLLPDQTDKTRAAAAVRRNNCQRMLNSIKHD
ncbi:PerC family transcriptional regulator [Enterobacter asburiae]|uniref:PerC family transcriptional regulator n=1 Tax=Enterobacter asburiae TaxID=61645 RepID=UPI002FD02A4C